MKERSKGFLTGLLTAALVLGLGGAALAAGRTVEIDDGVAVTINGVPFVPKDVNGKEVPLFAYDGTTYAPVRAFAEAAGLSVDYDAAKRTARIETADYTAQADPAAERYIGAAKAKEIALADAGTKADDALFLKAGLDWEDTYEGGKKVVKAVYEVEFCAGTTEYDYEIDALTGAVLKRDLDLPDFDWSRHDGYRIGHHQDVHHDDDHHDDDRHTVPAGLITAEKAQEIALGKAPGAVVVKCELDYEDDWGRWEHELELAAPGVEYECEIDAKTGEILKWEADWDE